MSMYMACTKTQNNETKPSKWVKTTEIAELAKMGKTTYKTNNINGVFSGGSRPSAKEGDCLTMNVEFFEGNSGTSKKMHYFSKPPLVFVSFWSFCFIFLCFGTCPHVAQS